MYWCSLWHEIEVYFKICLSRSTRWGSHVKNIETFEVGDNAAALGTKLITHALSTSYRLLRKRRFHPRRGTAPQWLAKVRTRRTADEPAACAYNVNSRDSDQSRFLHRHRGYTSRQLHRPVTASTVCLGQHLCQDCRHKDRKGTLWYWFSLNNDLI